MIIYFHPMNSVLYNNHSLSTKQTPYKPKINKNSVVWKRNLGIFYLFIYIIFRSAGRITEQRNFILDRKTTWSSNFLWHVDKNYFLPPSRFQILINHIKAELQYQDKIREYNLVQKKHSDFFLAEKSVLFLIFWTQYITCISFYKKVS